ncbi:hypothetical protein I316_02277 [Kwoniella heveanensis BCC8398]|uniref:Uncharacterized protein n=1 Tax=Kwoniella heveanensis BCC8398 TaxID=1296120 RepID=A0A1B9GXV0_9TREE|nr:hypothetical protein I316_02277 [Kwoniella heveanensis BCC8398]
MSGVFSAVKRFFRPKGLVGYDLQGNRYFEIPNPAGGRMKRFVEYKKTRDLSEYSRAELRPPGLSHTRVEPPTLPELSSDSARQESLISKVAAIEQREREERIRQGYLLPDGSVPPGLGAGGGREYGQVAGPSTATERRARIERIGSGSGSGGGSGSGQSQIAFQSQSNNLSQPISASGSASSSLTNSSTPSRPGSVPNALTSDNKYTLPQSSNAYPIPTPLTTPTTSGPGIAPPRDPRTVDPSKYASADELRRLAMEDTKRRIAELGGEPHSQQPSQSSDTRTGGGAQQGASAGAGPPLQPQSRSQNGGGAPGALQPRRRGRG